jgi:regulator of protease activity HflC (stomatin/prohibitin superfamily)
MYQEKNSNGWSNGWLVALCIILAIALVLGVFSVYTVPAGRVGVVTKFGAVNRVVYPGFGLKIPFVECVKRMDTRTQKDQIDSEAASRDLQVVTSTIAINYRLDGQYASDVYQNVGIEYRDVLIAPAVENIFKSVTAQFTAEELITKRDLVRKKAEDALASQLMEYHIIIERLNIVNFDFSPEYNEAIEKKQVAQQEVETAKQELAKAQVEAEKAIAEAQGQADAQAALNKTGALTDEYLRYLAITKWNGVLPVVVGSQCPLIDVTDFIQ